MSDCPALKFGLFTPECFDTLVTAKQFLDAPCLKKVIAKLIGFAVIAGSVILKVPQILKIVKSKSAEGLVVSSYALTLFTCIVNIAYNMNNNYPFSSYGENISIAIQDAIIVVLASVYGAGLGFSFVLLALVYASSTFALLTGMVAMEHILFLKTLNLPIFCASRLPQIYINFKNGHTGQLSLITVLLQFGGSAARVATTLAETGDVNELMNHGLAAGLNGLILLQVLYFWSATTKATAKKVDEKKKK